MTDPNQSQPEIEDTSPTWFQRFRKDILAIQNVLLAAGTGRSEQGNTTHVTRERALMKSDELSEKSLHVGRKQPPLRLSPGRLICC